MLTSKSVIEPLFTENSIIENWNVSPTTLKEAIRKGELPGFYDNGKFATQASFVNDWLIKRINMPIFSAVKAETRGRKTTDTHWADQFKASHGNA